MSSLLSSIHAYRRGEISMLGMLGDAVKVRADKNGTVLNRIPLKTFYEHLAVFGTTGAGKSNIYELLVKRFTKDALDQKMSLMVVDGSVFPNRVARYVDRSLRRVGSDRFFFFDPQPGRRCSMDHFIEANIFDMPASIRDQVSPDFVAGFYIDVCQMLFDQPLSNQMKTLIKYGAFLMEETGRPSLPLLRKVLRDPERYLRDCGDEDVVVWFRDEFLCKGSIYKKTADFVITRFDTVLSSKTLRKMFCAEEPKINVFDEYLAGGVFVFATRTAILPEVGVMLGRMAIMISGQISQMKAFVPGVPSIRLIDELHDYAIEKDIPSIRMSLKKDRKNGDGIAGALQQPGDLSKDMLGTFLNCSAIKCFGRMENDADAALLGKSIGISAADIQALQVGEFFVKIRGLHDKGIKVAIPPGSLGKWRNEKEKDRMEAEARESVNKARAHMAKRYGTRTRPKRSGRAVAANKRRAA